MAREERGKRLALEHRVRDIAQGVAELKSKDLDDFKSTFPVILSWLQALFDATDLAALSKRRRSESGIAGSDYLTHIVHIGKLLRDDEASSEAIAKALDDLWEWERTRFRLWLWDDVVRPYRHPAKWRSDPPSATRCSE